MACSICDHPRRAEIEKCLLLNDYGNAGRSLSDIAKEFKVSVQDLQVHAFMHTSMEQLERAEVGESIASSVKKREANLLSAVADEYYVTLKATGKQIRTLMNDEANGGARTVTKPLVELYLGTGNNLRQTLESIVEMNQVLNGDQDPGIQALANIVTAIRGSSDPK